MNFADTLGSMGVSILLIAFVLNMLNWIKSYSSVYSLLNMVGAGIACYASWLIHYIPFVILEGVWTAVSFTAVVKSFINNY
jgi:hypothetical protein